MVILCCNVDYVEQIKEVLLSMHTSDRSEIMEKYAKKVPESLTAQFSERREKSAAIQRQTERRSLQASMYPSSKYLQ